MSILSKQSVPRSVADPLESICSDTVCSAVSDNIEHSESVAVQANEMPLDSAARQTAALADTALSSNTQVVSYPTSEQQQILQALCVHPSLHSGSLLAASKTISIETAAMLDLDRVSFWQVEGQVLRLINRYERSHDRHVQGDVLSGDTYTPYLNGLVPSEAAAVETRAELTAEDVASIEWLSERSPLACLLQSSLIYPSGAFLETAIRIRGKVVGVLWCERNEAHCWSPAERTMALSVSLLLSQAMESAVHAALSSALDKQNSKLKRETIEREQAERAWQESQRFIQGIIDASTNILYVDSFSDGRNIYISRWIMNVLGYEAADIQKLGAQYLEKLVHADEKVQMVLERKKLSAINDGEVLENEYRFRHRQGNWRWLMCRETVFQRDEDGLPTQVFGTATDITKRKHAEMALQDLNRDLERLANMDGLTQVANRRSFDNRLTQEWQNVGSGRTSLSLILCDIDYFKSFNDTYGHQAGDVCLRRVAQAIEQAVKRSTDLVARYGGEEFAVILPSTDENGVQQVAKSIQQEVKQLDIPHSQSGASECITLSLGIAVVTSTENGHPDMLVAAADQGLYQAKYEGRNCYCLGQLETVQLVDREL